MMQSVISLLLLCFTSTSYAFVSHNPTTGRIPMVRNFRPFNQDEGARQERPVVQSKAKIVTINSAEEYKSFLAEDDRLCLIKIHASWCKSCKLFGKQYERIGREIGDLESVNDSSTIVREGEIRLAQIEFGKNTALCKSLGVTKVPSIQFYSQDKKVDDFPCGPKKIAHTLERLNYFRSLSPQQLAFEADMGQGEELGGELLEQLVTDNSNTEEGGKRKKILPNVAR